MMITILTQFLPPTQTRPARIAAWHGRDRVTVEYDHALDRDGRYTAAAKALCGKLGWGGTWLAGWWERNSAASGVAYTCITSAGPLRVLQAHDVARLMQAAERAAQRMVKKQGGGSKGRRA